MWDEEFLSVLSFLPIQTLKNKGDNQEVEEEPRVEQPNRGKLESQDGDSLDEESERY